MNSKPHQMKEIGLWRWNSDLLLSKVDRRGKNDCWPWLGSQSPSAPLFGARKNNRPQMTQAARILYREIYNEDCEEREITHSCGNRNCMNWNHWEVKDIKIHGARPNQVKQAKAKPVKNKWWPK